MHFPLNYVYPGKYGNRKKYPFPHSDALSLVQYMFSYTYMYLTMTGQGDGFRVSHTREDILRLWRHPGCGGLHTNFCWVEAEIRKRGVWKIRPMPGSKIRAMMRPYNSTKIWGFHQLFPRFCNMPDNYFLNTCSWQPWQCIVWIWGFLNTVKEGHFSVFAIAKFVLLSYRVEHSCSCSLSDPNNQCFFFIKGTEI
jgi:hypothetical protein